MSDEIEDTPAKSEAPAAKVAKKRPAVRKSSKPAPKAAEEAPSSAPEEPSFRDSPPPPAESVSSPASVEAAERRSEAAEDRSDDSSDGGRIAFLVETPAGEAGGNSKKRRRRKKKHGQQPPQGQGQHPHAVSVPHDGPAAPSAVAYPAAPSEPSSSHAPAMHAAPRPKLDPDLLAKKAWKIFQAEVGEEGLALIDDHDAREISRRCFRLAEIFMEEAARRGLR